MESIRPLSLVLVHGPLVAASSWAPTAQFLAARGIQIQVPDVLAGRSEPPAWRDWAACLEPLIACDDATVLVGHSAASVVVAALASRCRVGALLIVDGLVPPPHGAVAPATAQMRALLDSMARADGSLPPWSHWWPQSGPMASAVGVSALAMQPQRIADFTRELPRFNLSWFDDTIDLAPWRHVPTGYIQTWSLCARSANEAERLGWPLMRIRGTHLHPMLRPDETAAAIIRVCDALAQRRQADRIRGESPPPCLH
jgi:pimeloyl-ACP methyl ester carboxylesterase